MDTSRTNDEYYPTIVNMDRANGWVVITEDGHSVLLGKGYERKEWSFDKNRYHYLPRSTDWIQQGYFNIRKGGLF
jgi:predicted GNAT superfamily acetyltransferase